MDRQSWGYAGMGIAFLSYIVGYLQFDLALLAVTSFVAGIASLAAIWAPRTALAIVSVMCLSWTVLFPSAGIGLVSTIAAGALTVGFALMSAGHISFRPIQQVVGLGLAGVATTWYLVDNAILGWTPGFAVGNLVFIVGAGLAGFGTRARATWTSNPS